MLDNHEYLNNSKNINKIYNTLKGGMSLEQIKELYDCNEAELEGLFTLLKINGKEFYIETRDDQEVFVKKIKRKVFNLNINKNQELFHTKLVVVSDTHIGNNGQQLHLLNEAYKFGYANDVDAYIHVGDIVDGDYSSIRKEQARQIFLHGFDEQCGYLIDMYPKVTDKKTYYILGSHDETHYKNNQATIDFWVNRERDDMVFLGQDVGYLEINNLKITLDHPGDGSAQALSYKPQKRIEILETGFKPKILLIGHYHKQYYFVYRNVRGIEVPCLCNKTQFQQKKGLTNSVGFYYLDITSNNFGHILDFSVKPILYSKGDLWQEADKDANKVKRLTI